MLNTRMRTECKEQFLATSGFILSCLSSHVQMADGQIGTHGEAAV